MSARRCCGTPPRPLASPSAAEAVALGVEYVSLDDLLARSDIVSLHTNLSPETAHLIGAHAFSIMKRGAMLIK